MNAWIAARNTLGVGLSMAICVLAGYRSAALILGIGALFVSYSDGRDPYAHRARRMVASSCLSGLAVFFGSLVAHFPVLASVSTVGLAFGVGLSVVLGVTIADIFLFAFLMFVTFAAEPHPWERAFVFALLAFVGGVLQTSLSVLLWPIHRHRPVRRELGGLYVELGRLAVSRYNSKQAPEGAELFTRAQLALASLGYSQGLEGDRYRALFNQAERIRLCLISIRRLEARLARASVQENHASAVRAFLLLLRRPLDLIGQTLATDEPTGGVSEALAEMEGLLQGLRNGVQSVSSSFASAAVRDLLRQMEALLGQLRSANDLATNATPSGEIGFARKEAKKPLRLQIASQIANLRANLTLRSAGCRHGIRMALGVAIGQILVSVFHLERGYWIPLTIAIVLKPDYASTVTRGFLRILGTIAGLVVTTILLHYFAAGMATEFALLIVLMFVLRWIGAANYGIFAFVVSALVVLMFAITGIEPHTVIFARGINTLIGGAVALLLYVIWPTREREHVEETMARMLDLYRTHFRAVMDLELRRVAISDEAAQARMASRVARSNLLASLARVALEPGTTLDQIALLRGMQASSNRFIHAVMSLEAGGFQDFSERDRETFQNFESLVVRTLFLVAGVLRGAAVAPHEFPDLRAAFDSFVGDRNPTAESFTLVQAEADRMTNSLNTLRQQALRWRRERGRR